MGLKEEVMIVTDYGWIKVNNGLVIEVRPKSNPAFLEIAKCADFASTWNNLQIAEWVLSPGHKIPKTAEFEIQIERPKEFTPPVGNAAIVVVEGPGSFSDNVRTIQHRFEVNGWDFVEVISAMNAPPSMIFTKPAGTPEVFPFVEPSVKDP